MKIYLAAKYGDMMKMREVAEFLRNDGHEITAQWVDGKEANDTQESAALMDFEDVLRSDVLVSFSHERGTMHTGGGRHVEFGIALTLGKKIIVCGPRGEHVFHSMPGVKFVADMDQLALVLLENES